MSYNNIVQERSILLPVKQRGRVKKAKLDGKTHLPSLILLRKAPIGCSQQQYVRGRQPTNLVDQFVLFFCGKIVLNFFLHGRFHGSTRETEEERACEWKQKEHTQGRRLCSL